MNHLIIVLFKISVSFIFQMYILSIFSCNYYYPLLSIIMYHHRHSRYHQSSLNKMDEKSLVQFNNNNYNVTESNYEYPLEWTLHKLLYYLTGAIIICNLIIIGSTFISVDKHKWRILQTKISQSLNHLITDKPTQFDSKYTVFNDNMVSMHSVCTEIICVYSSIFSTDRWQTIIDFDILSLNN